MCIESVQRCSETVQLFENRVFASQFCLLNLQRIMAKHKFILNDETKLNQYGFRVLNAGLDLERFRSNPVLLDSHRSYGTEGVIGRWENIQIEGSLLTAEAVFDESDIVGKRVSDKVAGGFLKGASLGLNPFSMDNFKSTPDGHYELVKSEVLEASVVSIPNNANAIKLYATTKEGLEQLKDSDVPEILLMANEISNFKNQPNMLKIKLSAVAAMAIALNADIEHDVDTVNAGILKLKADLDAEKQKVAGLEELEKDKKAKLSADTVDADIKAGKLDATKREEFIKLHAENGDLYKTVISAIPAKQNLGAQVANPVNASDIKSIDDFEKLNLSAQLDFKNANPDAYKALFN